jgi:adenosylcobinamide-GDP ribazoletransferase
MIRPFLIALQFLTRLPVWLAGELAAEDLGRSLLYYPLVGIILGGLLAASAWLLSGAPPLLAGALVLTLWVVLTGALHLDGLADTIDAWAGGRGDPERTLALMKDPHCGPQGVTGLVLVLVLKFAALAALLEAGDYLPLILAPFLARTALPLLFLTTPYVRPGGLGAALASGLPRRAGTGVLIAASALTPLLAGAAGLLTLASTLAAFYILRRAMTRRIGGTTGDTAGALVEIAEAIALLAGALLAGSCIGVVGSR